MNESLVKELLEQNKMLIAMISAQATKQKKAPEEIIMDKLKAYNPVDINEFINNIFNPADKDNHFPLTIDHCMFQEIGFLDSCVRILKFVNNEARPIHLCNKKDKTFFVYVTNEWEKVNFGDASSYIRRILNRCIVTLVYIVRNNTTKTDDWKDHNYVIMCGKQTDEYADRVLNCLLDMLFVA